MNSNKVILNYQPQKILLSAAGLQQVATLAKENNFTFIVGGHEYPCNSFFADFISPNVAKLHISDPLADSYTIQCKDNNNEFNLIMKIMHGEKIKISPNDQKYIRKIAKKLGNAQLFDDFIPTYETEDEIDIDYQFVISILNTKHQYNFNFQKEADLIAKQFHRIDHNLFRTLPIDVIETILNSNKLLLDMESELFNLIMDLSKNVDPSYSRLFSSVVFENLEPKAIENFMKEFGPEKLDPSIWKVLCDRLSRVIPEYIDLNRYKKATINCPYSSEQTFNGILKFISKEYRTTPLDSYVRISVNDDHTNTPAIKNLLNGENPNWSLTDAADNYLLFEFRKFLVTIKGYEIRSGSNSRWGYPHSWVIEISMDKENWTIIDEKQENKEMGGNDKTHYWEISEKDKTQTARFVRWRLTASSNSGSGSGSLSFSQWEFYGDIVRPLNESDL